MELFLKESKKKHDVTLILEKHQIKLTRDDFEFHSTLTPLDLAGYVLACAKERAESKLIDRNARFVFQGRETPALFLVRPTVGSEGGFKSVPAVISVQNYDTVNPVAFDTVITAIDAMNIFSSTQKLYSSEDWYAVAGTVTVAKEKGRLLIRCGGSEPSELTEQVRKDFLHRLARYLSGQWLENGSEQKFSPSFFNRDGCFFNGRRDARIRVNGIATPLSYSEVASLYIVLSAMRGRDADSPEQP